MTQEEKQRAVDLLGQRLKAQRPTLANIEQRLEDYFINIWANPDDHNAYEILGAVKFLRLLCTYETDIETFKDVVYKYEGVWEQRDGVWYHIEGGLKHPGTTGPRYYRLQPFQVFVLASMFLFKAWINTEAEAGTRELLPTEEIRDGYIWDLRRLCTEFTLYTPRKTAKTQLSAFIQFWYFMSGDENAECYCCANASDQSKILFNRTKDLIHQMDPKEKRIRFTATQVNWKPGQFRSASLSALSAGGRTKDGLFAALCSADEFGSAAYVNGASDMGKLVSVVESSMGPRREPMTFISTTAGIIQAGPFVDKLQGVKMLLEKELDPEAEHTISEDRQMCLLLEPDEWEQQDEELLLTSKAVRRKVNPMLGVIVQHSFYEDEIAKARQNPEKMNEVITKLLNVYKAGRVKDWLKPEDIRPLQQPWTLAHGIPTPRRIDDCLDIHDWIVFAGMDFSKGDDLNGTSYLAYNRTTGDFFADMDSYMSEEAVNQSPIRELLLKWAKDGWLHIVPGKTFDPSWPVNRIVELNGDPSKTGIDFWGFGYDAFNAKNVVNALSQWAFDNGYDPKQLIQPVRQNFATYSPAVKEFDYMVKRSRDDGAGHRIPEPMIHFSENPLWPWEFGNVMLQESNDGMENLKPVKREANGKVDNIQMLLSALILYDAAESQIKK
jgi:phage terminase large subunit-like protein